MGAACLQVIDEISRQLRPKQYIFDNNSNAQIFETFWVTFVLVARLNENFIYSMVLNNKGLKKVNPILTWTFCVSRQNLFVNLGAMYQKSDIKVIYL